MNRDLEDRSTPTASSERYMNTSERYMNAYERAHARAYMEQAMAPLPLANTEIAQFFRGWLERFW